MAKNTKIALMSKDDNSIVVESSYDALQLAEQNPTEPKYQTWLQVIIVFDEVANGSM